MIETMELPDPSIVSPFLRSDVLRNCGMLASIERNIPPFPRTVWAARRKDHTIGAMLVTDGPGQGTVDLRATDPQAIEPLLRCLDPDRPYSFSVPAHLLDAFLPHVRQPAYKSQTVILSARPDDLRSFRLDLDYHRLTLADRPAVQVFPESASYEPPLAMYLDWALARPEGLAMYGLFEAGCLIGHVGWAVQIDNVWEATFIRIRSDRRGKGLGRALLARSTRDLLAAGHIPLYELDSSNHASLRIAIVAGYHEITRIHHYDALRP